MVVVQVVGAVAVIYQEAQVVHQVLHMPLQV